MVEASCKACLIDSFREVVSVMVEVVVEASYGLNLLKDVNIWGLLGWVIGEGCAWFG